jgi:hypothetical protein
VRTEVPLPRGAVMIMVGGRTDGWWFNFPLSYVSNPQRNSDITGVNSAHGACSAAQGVFTVYSEFALRSPGDTHSEHHRTSGHLQFTRDSNSLGGASEFDRALGISLGVRCCAPQDGPRQSSRREGPADKVYGICPLPAAAAVSLQGTEKRL